MRIGVLDTQRESIGQPADIAKTAKVKKVALIRRMAAGYQAAIP